jgi:hypothetical protein
MKVTSKGLKRSFNDLKKLSQHLYYALTHLSDQRYNLQRAEATHKRSGIILTFVDGYKIKKRIIFKTMEMPPLNRFLFVSYEKLDRTARRKVFSSYAGESQFMFKRWRLNNVRLFIQRKIEKLIK